MDWEKYWSDKSDDRRGDPTPDGIAREGREKLLHLGSGGRLLDVGCGTGKLLSHYTANFPECIGVERSPTMLAEAQTKLRDTNIALLHGSAENVWEIVHGDFDAITMGSVAQYLAAHEIAAFVMQASKHLKPGGRIAIFDIIHSRKAVLRMMGLGRHKEAPSGFEIVTRSGVVFARWAAWPLIAKGRTFHPDGRMYAPEFFAAIAKENGMKINMPMSMSSDLFFAGAAQIAHQVRQRALSALEIATLFLDRIDANRHLNAYITVNRDLVLREAESLSQRVQRGEDPGPLAGVPVAVKDLMSVRGYPLTA